MSQIFEALQRSQAERAIAHEEKPLAAIELLGRAERETQRGSEPSQTQTDETVIEHPGSFFSGEGLGPGVTEKDPNVIANVLQGEQQREVFSQFQTLELSQSKHNRLVCLGDNDSPAIEAFHLLGMRVRNLRKKREVQSLLITSTVPEEGKSVVAANLACTLGSSGREKVLLIEGDVRRPSQSKIFGLSQVPGLCNYLLGKRSLAASLYHIPQAGIWMLPAGDNRGDLKELLQSPELPGLMKVLNSLFDWIVINSPPVLPLVDTTIWARLADGILIVARPGKTRKQKLQKGLETLDPNKLVGAVLNSSNSTNDSYEYYYTRTSDSQKDQGAVTD
jgi:capsular exopolysaccharide synthesis family protein